MYVCCMKYVHIDTENRIATVHSTVSGLGETHGIKAETIRVGLRRCDGWWVSRSGSIVCKANEEVNKKLSRASAGGKRFKK